MDPVSPPLASFPPARADTVLHHALLVAQGIRVRAGTVEDMAFVRQLYGDLRAEELHQTGWPDAVRQAFLDSQFALQHRHFVTYYAAADFLMVEHDGVTIGRFYLLRATPYFLVVDIALVSGWRGRGIGHALLEWAKEQARQAGAAGVDLHVDERNAGARRLYARIGFVETARDGVYLGMRWQTAAFA